jgi:hypothetical protein
MKFTPKGTIRSYLSIPQVVATDLSAFPVPEAAVRVKQYWNYIESNSMLVHPEFDAVSFYALNHLVAIIRSNFDQDEILPDWAQKIMGEYVVALSDQGKRLYAYMLLIITRESRHLKNPATALKNAHPAHKSFHSMIKGSGSIVTANSFCANPPDQPLGKYTSDVVHLFNQGSFSGGYGGKPWGNIANCVSQMVNGKTSIEMMVDSAYCLAHNNGPMFNKGMLYHTHSTTHLTKILDVQRSGQIPEAVLNKEVPSQFIPPGILTAVKTMKANYPEAFGDYVDWNKVEDLGGYHKYSAEKAAMPKTAPAPIKAGNGKVYVPGEQFFVMPGVAVTKLTRKAA